MKISSYTKFIGIVCGVLTVLSLAGAVALYLQGPRVRAVRYERNPSTAAHTYSSLITIQFNRILQQQDYTEQISVTPALDFDATTSGSTIILTLQENLRSGTTYNFSVGPYIIDSSNNQMSGTYELQIETAPTRFAYIERNYGPAAASSLFTETDADDHIVLSSVDNPTEREILFSDPAISSFDANAQYALVATAPSSFANKLYYIDSASGSVTPVELAVAGRIGNVAVHDQAPIGLYTLTPDLNTVGDEVFDEFANRIYGIDFSSGETWVLTNQDGVSLQAFDLDYSGSSQAVLLQDPQLDFYIASVFNDFDPAPIGSFTQSYGYSDDLTDIVFRDFDDIVVLDIAAGTTQSITEASTARLDSVQISNNMIFAQQSASALTSGSSSLATIDQASITDIWNDQFSGGRLNTASVSFDARHAALEIRPESCTLDRVSPNSRCQEAYTILLNTVTQDEIDIITGFDVVWLP